jgi:hypothetical protein
LLGAEVLLPQADEKKMPDHDMATNVLLLTLMGAGCVCSMCCLSSVIFVKTQRDLAADVQYTSAYIATINEVIAGLNAVNPPPVTIKNVENALPSPQDMTSRTGAFRVPWWQGCLVAEKDKVRYVEKEPSRCATDLIRVPTSPFKISSATTSRIVNDAFVIQVGNMYVGADRKLVAEKDRAVRLRQDPTSGTLEMFPIMSEDPTKSTQWNSIPCWNIRSKQLYDETDRVKNNVCAKWEIP